MPNRFDRRDSGILLHITSLPSSFGIGGLGREAYSFVDYLARHKQTHWQILPLNFPGYGNSPYNAISSFAGNPYLIDPTGLVEKGWLKQTDLYTLPPDGSVDYAAVYQQKDILFATAWQAFLHEDNLTPLYEYIEKEAYWLKPFMLFCYYRSQYGESWLKWLPDYRDYRAEMYAEVYAADYTSLLYHAFLQFVFDMQLSALKAYMTDKGIKLIGDLPLYVSLDSADTWSHRELFELNKEGKPLRVAGVPPDAFSSKGQLWGNPLYRWDIMKEQGFTWWIRRLLRILEYADYIRIDHFIGIENYWAVDARYKTAKPGAWFPGPSQAFFDAVLRHIPAGSIIAEDLGILTEAVNHLRDSNGFPGMIILQFCFQDGSNDILSFPRDKVIYTGTHDNHTSAGWYIHNQQKHKPDNGFLMDYLSKLGWLTDASLSPAACAENMLKLALASPCHLAIIPLQDVLALDDTARMNIPGTATGNWQWRLQDASTLQQTHTHLLESTLAYRNKA